MSLPPDVEHVMRRIRRIDSILVGVVWASGLLMGTLTRPEWWVALLMGVLVTAGLLLVTDLVHPRQEARDE